MNRETGLCASCRWMRRVQSSRGNDFYLCGRSAIDAQFPKYPVLPVIACSGFDAVDPKEDGSTQ